MRYSFLPSSVRPLEEVIFATSTIFTAQTRSLLLSKHLRITLNVPLRQHYNFELLDPIYDSNTKYKPSKWLNEKIRSHQSKIMQTLESRWFAVLLTTNSIQQNSFRAPPRGILTFRSVPATQTAEESLSPWRI